MPAANMSATAAPTVSVDPTGAYVAPQAATTTAAPGFYRSIGGINIATTTVTVNATATVLVSARTGRSSLKVVNLGGTEVFIGNASVTLANGDLLLGVRGTANTYGTGAAVSAIATTGTQEVRVTEIY